MNHELHYLYSTLNPLILYAKFGLIGSVVPKKKLKSEWLTLPKNECYFVATGYPLRVHENEEWRISLPQTEY